MKKIRNILLILISSSTLLLGCKAPQTSESDDPNISDSTSLNELETPTNVTLNDRTLTWDEVSGATSYVVLLNNDEHTTNVNSLLLPATIYGVITVQVKAKTNEISSSYSEEQTFEAYLTLGVPQNLRQVGSKIEWNEVTLATGYIVKINNSSEKYTVNNYYDITNDIVKVKVLATANDPYLRSSAYSDELLIKAQLGAPLNIVFNDGLLSWDEVSNALQYKIQIDDTLWGYSNSNSALIGYYKTGLLTIKIQALGDETYLDSEITSVEINVPKIKLATPTNLVVTGNVLTFDPVLYAESYNIYVDGLLKAGITTNSYTFSQEVIDNAHYVQVKANSDANYASNLSEKYFFHVILIDSEQELLEIVPYSSYRLNADIVLTSPWTPKFFAGTFDGAGYTISGININEQEKDIGFFSSLNGATISNLKLDGQITSENNDEFEPNIGGLAGAILDSTISNVEILVDITSSANNGIAKVGGITGVSKNSTFENVHYSGNIAADFAISGGFIGLLNQSDNAVMINRSSSNGTLTVTGGEQTPAGGFIGQMLDNYMNIYESKASVNVTGPNYVGGFVGYMGYGHISDSYSEGNIEATSTSLVHLGGFIGRVEGYNNIVDSCLALTAVSNKSGDNVFVGAFVGVTPGGTHATIYDNCAYDNTLSTMDRIGNSATGKGDGITGYTSEELLTELNYSLEVWDFSSTKPRLKWELE